MTLNESISSIANDIGLSPVLVGRIYRAYWKAVREHIESLPLMDDLSDEEFMKLRPNVNIPSIGKLHVTLDRYHRMKKHYEIKQEIFRNKLKDNKNVEN